MSAAGYARPTTLDEATRLLASRPFLPLAGGTDVYPAHVGRDIAAPVLDLGAIAALRGVAREGDAWRIGATTTWSDVVAADLPPLFDGLKAAARDVGGVQIQNAGTVAGNVCNASPAADGVPPLLALDAEVVLASLGGERRLPLARFLRGARRTERRDDELVTAIVVPGRGAGARSAFVKLGARRHLVISIVMASAVIEVDDDGVLRHVAVAVGSCSAIAQRLARLEQRLVGRRVLSTGAGMAHGGAADIGAGPADLGAASIGVEPDDRGAAPIGIKPADRGEAPIAVEPEDLEPLRPIDDIRGSAAYRLDAARTLVERLLVSAIEPAAMHRP